MEGKEVYNPQLEEDLAEYDTMVMEGIIDGERSHYAGIDYSHPEPKTFIEFLAEMIKKDYNDD